MKRWIFGSAGALSLVAATALAADHVALGSGASEAAAKKEALASVECPAAEKSAWRGPWECDVAKDGKWWCSRAYDCVKKK